MGFPVTHHIPQHDTIDHDTTSRDPAAVSQCVCGPDWELDLEPYHFHAFHRSLHGRM